MFSQNMNDDDTEPKLEQLYESGLHIYEELERTSLTTNSREFQDKVLKGIKYLEDATKLVNELSLFSANESIEEVSTGHLKFLLLPALLGNLMLKSQQCERREIIHLAEVYFNDYIQRLNDYAVCDVDIRKGDDNGPNGVSKEPSASSSRLSGTDTLEAAARRREEKIARYRHGKDMDERIKTLKEQMTAVNGTIDDEIIRNYYLTLMKRWVNTAQDEINSIEMEKPILEHMSQMKALGQRPEDNSKRLPAPKRLKPIIITKTDLQKKIFGLGYPSIPTVTIDEFVNKKIEEGTLSLSDPRVYDNSLLQWADDPQRKRRDDEIEEERKERENEIEDPLALKKARDWDDWKDEHRRGEGNRKNMG